LVATEASSGYEKTDHIDTWVIGWFGAVKGTAPAAPAGAEQERFKALVTRMSQLIEPRIALFSLVRTFRTTKKGRPEIQGALSKPSA